MLIRDDYPRRIALGTTALALLVTVPAVVGIVRGGVPALAFVLSPVLICCAALAMVGWRRARPWMTLTASIGVLAAVFGGSWLFAP
ncbi:hypothetical protein [Streptomyces sp. NPDC048612]|uniref:hypothetical protein n=1 Tax=Streptomyces sp. NPDC048612 TaxID=3365579 RepID=UPI00371A4B9A